MISRALKVNISSFVLLTLLLLMSSTLGHHHRSSLISKAEASTPDRLFLPMSIEVDWLIDLKNLLEFIGERSHLEPWYSMHPPLSIGKPNRGRLLFGHKMRTAFGLWVMQPEDSYTSLEVALTLYALNALVRRAHPGGSDLMVLDIAQESGGKFDPHRSHQTGGDVDLRYYFKSVGPNDHKKRYVHASKIDMPRMWTFMKIVSYYNLGELIFVDHVLQKALYDYGKKKLNMDDKELKAFLSYPVKGRRRGALLQHVSGHYNHMHLRIRQDTSYEWRDLKLKDVEDFHLSYLKNRTGFFEYVVQPGQTMSAIAAFNQVRLRDLFKWNEMNERSIIYPGQILKVWR